MTIIYTRGGRKKLRFWSILSLVFNQMCDDAEFALETHVFCLLPIPHTHTYTTRTFRKIIFWRYTWSVRSRPSVFSLQMLYEVIIYVVWNAVDLYI